MTEIRPHTTASQDEYPYWVPDGMDQGDPSIYDNVMTWLRSPRRWKDREIEHLRRVINANNGLYADQIARGMMIPSVDDYPFDPKKLVRLADGFDGIAVEMEGHNLKICFVEGNHAGDSGIPSMTGRQREMRRAVNRGWVEVRLCHLILHSDGSHEWEISD